MTHDHDKDEEEARAQLAKLGIKPETFRLPPSELHDALNRAWVTCASTPDGDKSNSDIIVVMLKMSLRSAIAMAAKTALKELGVDTESLALKSTAEAHEALDGAWQAVQQQANQIPQGQVEVEIYKEVDAAINAAVDAELGLLGLSLTALSALKQGQGNDAVDQTLDMVWQQLQRQAPPTNEVAHRVLAVVKDRIENKAAFHRELQIFQSVVNIQAGFRPEESREAVAQSVEPTMLYDFLNRTRTFLGATEEAVPAHAIKSVGTTP